MTIRIVLFTAYVVAFIVAVSIGSAAAWTLFAAVVAVVITVSRIRRARS